MIQGLDTNILCYALDPAFPENQRYKKIILDLSAERKVGLNPTVLHETYHVLVYDQGWDPTEARRRLVALLNHPHIEFYNQSRRISILALDLAVRHDLGGRDSLILSNLMANNVPVLYTHDRELLSLKQITDKRFAIKLEDPAP